MVWNLQGLRTDEEAGPIGHFCSASIRSITKVGVGCGNSIPWNLGVPTRCAVSPEDAGVD